MFLSIAGILSADELIAVRRALDAAIFIDGTTSAGWSAKLVKANLQAGENPDVARARDLVAARLMAHPVFAIAAHPKTIIGPHFSKHGRGDVYGAHVDDATMEGTRIDVSFTLFLSPLHDYDGGELIIDTPAAEEAIKLDPGSAFLYPATTLHRVATVTRGQRLAAVGWVRSMVRNQAQRELLFDLETARRRLFDRDGKSAEFDLLSKCSANLMRMWCED
jgi:PKHD-type hydroxylase